MTDPSPLRPIHARAVSVLREYRTGPEEQRTNRLRDAAATLVDAREHFFTKDGEVDWVGRTYAYRMWVRTAALEAGFTPDEVPTVLAAVRYHVGAALRSKISAESIRALGLSDESQRERSVSKRERQTRTLSLVSGAGIETAEDVVDVLRLFTAALGRVEPAAVKDADEEARAAIADGVQLARTRLTQLLAFSR
jgi:hypothetical protein